MVLLLWVIIFLSISFNSHSQESDLFFAVRRGDVELIEKLIKNGEDVNVYDNSKLTPLFYAVGSGNLAVSELLIKSGADVNAIALGRTYWHWTPLHYAVSSGRLNCSKLLIQNGADVNAVAKDGFTPLHIAVKYGYSDLVKLLIESGADINKKDNKQKTPLIYAVASGNFEITKILIENGADVNASFLLNYTPLYLAASEGFYDIAKLLIENGANINASVSAGFTTPLISAVKQNNYKIVKLLLENGANANEKNTIDRTPLHYAAIFNSLASAKILLDFGADTSVKDINGDTPKSLALKYNSFEVYNFLTNPQNYEILALFYLNEDLKIIKKLKENPDLLNFTDSKGYSILHLAVYYANNELFDSLLTIKNLNLNLTDTLGNTPLLLALKLNKIYFAKQLIKAGCEVNIRDKKGFSPLYIANFLENKTLENLLIDSGAKFVKPKRQLIVQQGHTKRVVSVAFSPDGKIIASASDDNTLKLWNVETGQLIKTIYGFNKVNFIRFSNNGLFLAVVSENQNAKLINVLTGELLITFDDTKGADFISFSDDDNYISIASCDFGKKFNIKKIKLVSTFGGHISDENSQSFYENFFIWPSGNDVVITTTFTAKEVGRLRGHKDKVNAVKFSPDGNFVATASGDKTIKIWDFKKRKEIRTLEAAKTPQLKAISKDRKLFAVEDNGDIKVFSFETLSLVNYSDFNFWDTTSVIKKYEVAIDSQDIILKNFMFRRVLKGHSKLVNSVSFSADKKFLVSGSDDKTVKLWDIKTAKVIQNFTGHKAEVSFVAFFDSTKIISADKNGIIKLWDINTGKELFTFYPVSDSEYVAISPEGYFRASKSAKKYLHFVIGLEVSSLNLNEKNY